MKCRHVSVFVVSRNKAGLTSNRRKRIPAGNPPTRFVMQSFVLLYHTVVVQMHVYFAPSGTDIGNHKGAFVSAV